MVSCTDIKIVVEFAVSKFREGFEKIRLFQLAGRKCWKYRMAVPVVGAHRKLGTVFNFVRTMKGYERNVELIGKNQRGYGSTFAPDFFFLLLAHTVCKM
jgi:hypothetical protein